MIASSIIAAGIGAVGSAISSSQQAGAARAAANASERATEQTIAEQRRQYDLTRADFMPILNRGNQAGEAYNALLGIGGNPDAARAAFDTYRGGTGYDFRVQQGQDAITQNRATRGMLLSSGDLQRQEAFRQNIASDEFGRYLGYLQGQAGTAGTAANALAANGSSYASAVGNALTKNADVLGSSYLARANASSNAIGSATNAIAYGIGNWNRQPSNGVPY